MTPVRRWCVVALIVAAVVAVSAGPRLLPVSDSDVSAAGLLQRVQASEDHAFSGLVETTGRVDLPASDQFSDVGSLFGGQSRLRVWWRDSTAWRVDQLATAGETDLIHDGERTTQYDYADAKARTGLDAAIRLPRDADLLPPTLAHTVLSGAQDDEVSRLPVRRIAGIAAPGLRLRPASSQTTIDHVDVWADPTSGVPLRVDVYGPASSAAFSTTFLGFSSGTPDSELVAFHTPDGVDGSFQSTLDIADAANQYAPLRPPQVLAGLTRTSTEPGAVGVYGTGVTRFIAIPLRDRDADPLRTSLNKTIGSRIVDLGQAPYFAGPPDTAVPRVSGTTVAAGPLTVLLTDDGGGGSVVWLLAGTVTQQALTDAARGLIVGTTYLGQGG